MSLLMDALRKAELAKRQAKGLQAPTAGPPDKAGSAEAGGTTASRTVTATELAMLDDEFPPTGPRTGSQQTETGVSFAKGDRAAEGNADRVAAQNLFAAKQPPSRLPLYIGLGATLLFAIAGIGYYFWLQMRPFSGAGIAPGAALSSAPSASRAAQPKLAPSTAPVAAPPSPSTATPSVNTSRLPQAGALVSQPSVASASTANAAGPKPTPAMTRAPASQSMPSDQPAQGRMSSEGPAGASEPRLPLRVGAARQPMNTGITAGYQAFQSGDLAAARQSYEQVLRNEPRNSDALHGLAAISLRLGNHEAAETLYTRALEADPKDALAQSALISLRGEADPIKSESRLKGLLAAQPDAPYLHFSLGNLYAREGRWAEAQQAYFRAHSRDPENPDYLFNLAVSLDQMHQPKLAMQFYQNALTAATTRSAAFDKRQAETRIRELQQ